MAFCHVYDVNFKIIKKLGYDFQLILSLSQLNKTSYDMVTSTNIYKNIKLLNLNNTHNNITKIMEKYCEFNMIQQI